MGGRTWRHLHHFIIGDNRIHTERVLMGHAVFEFFERRRVTKLHSAFGILDMGIPSASDEVIEQLFGDDPRMFGAGEVNHLFL